MNDEREVFNRALAISFVRSRAAHTGVEVTAEAFGARVESVVLKNSGSFCSWLTAAQAALELHTDDLYLATACAQSNEVAWQRLRSLYFRLLSDIFYYGSSASDSPADLANDLLSDLFLPDCSGRCRIATFDGRSSLATWLRTIAGNRQINHRRRKRYEYCILEAIPEPRDLTAAKRFDSVLRDGGREKATIGAFSRACATLSSEERQLLIWRYGTDCRIGQIAERIGVHQSTITRQIEKICRRVRNELQSILATEHHLSRDVIDDCIDHLQQHQEDSGFIWKALEKTSSGLSDPAAVSAGAAFSSFRANVKSECVYTQEDSV